MPSSVIRSIRISGQSVMVAIRATTGRFSLSTTALARMDLNVSGASCIANISRGCGRLQREGALFGLARRGQLSRLSPQKFTRFEIAPSTTRFEPVVNDEAGLAKNTAALAISCGVAMRPVGLRASVSAYRLGAF